MPKKKTIALAAVLREIGCTRNRLNGWRAAGLLEDLPAGSPGVSPAISIETGLTIAFMTCLNVWGVPPELAYNRAVDWVHERREERLPQFYIATNTGVDGPGSSSGGERVADLVRAVPARNAPVGILVLPLVEIAQRIEALA